jgi:hypothetical protein
VHRGEHDPEKKDKLDIQFLHYRVIYSLLPHNFLHDGVHHTKKSTYYLIFRDNYWGTKKKERTK